MADRFKGRVSHEIKALGTSIIVKGTVIFTQNPLINGSRKGGFDYKIVDYKILMFIIFKAFDIKSLKCHSIFIKCRSGPCRAGYN